MLNGSVYKNTAMKRNAINSLSPDELFATAFHPTPTLRCHLKSFFSGAWYYLVAIAFFTGLPAVAVWVLDVVPRLFGQ